MDLKSYTGTNFGGKWTIFIIISVIAFLCTILNVRVFKIVYTKSTLKSRPANILVAHLSLVVIGFTWTLFIYFLEKLSLISLSLPGLCNLLSLSTQTIYTLFSLNTVAVVWVRTRKDTNNIERDLAFQAIRYIWITALLCNLPSYFIGQSVRQPDTMLTKCKQVNIFGSIGFIIAYDAFRYLIVNMMVCIYFLRVTFKLRYSLKYLQMQLIPTERTVKQIKQVRFVHRHTTLLMITWIPHGIGAFIYTMQSQLGWITSGLEYTLPLTLVIHTLFVLCPLSYAFILENISPVKIFVPCWQSRDTSNLPLQVNSRSRENPEAFGRRVYPPLRPKTNMPVTEKSVTWSKKGGIQIKGHYHLRLMEMSMITTVGPTGASGSLFNSMALMTPLQLPIILQGSSSPAVPTTSTAQRLKEVVVEVHAEPENCPNNEDTPEFTKRSSEMLI